MNQSHFSQIHSQLRLRLLGVVIVASLLFLAMGGYFFSRTDASSIVATVFFVAGFVTAVAGGFYLWVILPVIREREDRALKEKRAALTDVVGKRISSNSRFKSVEDPRLSGRDWRLFLGLSPLNLKASSVRILAQSALMFESQSLLLIYARCENQSLDKNHRVFEGWIAHLPEAKEQDLVVRDHLRLRTFDAAFVMAILIPVVLIIYALARKWWPQLTSLDVTVIGSSIAVLIGLIAAAYLRTFARTTIFNKKKPLPAHYLPLHQDLSKSKDVEFFRMITSPGGLLVAVQPHPGTLPGYSLDLLLNGIAQIANEKK